MQIKRALLSVSDKTNLIDFARFLIEQQVEILSTGGTAKALRDADIAVTDVADVTAFPEIMGGRVKTLHPKIHGGILARRGVDEAVMETHQIPAIDLVCVNLYPFSETIAKPDCSYETAVENIDIGGPAMVRAAAKNHASVTVLTDHRDYAKLREAIGNNRLDHDLRQALAAKAFAHTSAYDARVAQYLAQAEQPSQFLQNFSLESTLRYGENPHQSAAFYRADTQGACVANSEVIQGKALSYNNLADADAALECVRQFDQGACVIVKHANPCGVALHHIQIQAYERAYATDPTSAFGGIIAFNRPLDGDTAKAMVAQQFIEVVLAPSFSEAALSALSAKPNVRVLAVGDLSERPDSPHTQSIVGGLLVQDRDLQLVDKQALSVVSKRAPSPEQIDDLYFAWQVAKFVKSNAIVYAKDAQTIGIGAGQMSRVYSAKIAGIKAADEQLEVRGSVMASDAFFPFRDGIDAAAEAGIAAVIQPGGSMRDDEIIAAADEHDLAMVFTGMRHFRH